MIISSVEQHIVVRVGERIAMDRSAETFRLRRSRSATDGWNDRRPDPRCKGHVEATNPGWVHLRCSSANSRRRPGPLAT